MFFFFFGLLRPGMEEIIGLWLKVLVEMMEQSGVCAFLGMQ